MSAQWRLTGGGVVAGEPVQRGDFDRVPELLITFTEPVAEDLCGTARDHVQQPLWAGLLAHGGQIDQHRHERRIAVAADAFLLVLINTEPPHPGQMHWSAGQLASRRQRNRVDRAPRQAQPCRGCFHRHSIQDQPLQDPLRHPAGHLRPR